MMLSERKSYLVSYVKEQAVFKATVDALTNAQIGVRLVESHLSVACALEVIKVGGWDVPRIAQRMSGRTLTSTTTA